MCKENLSSYEIIQALHSSILAWRIPWTDGGAWWATVHGVAKSPTRLSDFSFSSLFFFLFFLFLFFFNAEGEEQREGSEMGLLEAQWLASFRYYQIPYNYAVEVRNRFKGLDLIDRVPDELWNQVCDIVQETGIKTIPMGKKCKKAKWLSGEALQIAVKRREVKSKWEKER